MKEGGRHTHIPFLLVLAGFIALRLVLVLSNIDSLHELDRAEVKHFSLSGELTAHDMKGHWLDPQGLHGGYTLNIILYWILARLLGEGYFTLKCVALLFSAATLWTWMALLRRFIGPAAALLFAALFSLPSAAMIAWTSTVWGSHPESCFFSALTVYLYFRFFHPAPRPVGPKGAILFGAFLGLAAYFSLLFLPTIFLCLAFYAYKQGKRSILPLAVMLVSMAAVFGPLNYLKWKKTNYYLYDSRGGELVRASLGRLTLDEFVTAARSNLDWPVAPMVPSHRRLGGGLDLKRLNQAASAVLFLAGVLALVRARPDCRGLLIFLYAYPLAYFLFLAGANPQRPEIPIRYLIVGLPFLFACMGAAVSGEGSTTGRLHGAARAALGIVLALSLLCGVREATALFSRERLSRWSEFRTIEYVNLKIGRVHFEYLDGVNRFVDFARSRPDDDRVAGFRIVFPLVSYYDCLFDRDRCVQVLPEAAEMRAAVGELEKEGRRLEALLEGVGWAVGIRRAGDRAECGAIFGRIAPDDPAPLWRGYERGLAGRAHLPEEMH